MTSVIADSPDTTASSENSSPTLLLGYTGEDWDRWLIYAVMLAALAAVAVGFATAGSIISHKREADAAQKDLERYKTTVEGKVADAKKEGLEAGRNAADALARAAEANAKALESELKLERIRAPRTIDPDDAVAFVRTMHDVPKIKADILVLADGLEAAKLGNIIGHLLFSDPLKWTGGIFRWTGGGAAEGVVVLAPSDADEETKQIGSKLGEALNAAHVSTTLSLWPGEWEKFGGFMGGTLTEGAKLRVVIGTKPL